MGRRIRLLATILLTAALPAIGQKTQWVHQYDPQAVPHVGAVSSVRNGRVAVVTFRDATETATEGMYLTLHDISDGHAVWTVKLGLLSGWYPVLVELGTNNEIVVAYQDGPSLRVVRLTASTGTVSWSAVFPPEPNLRLTPMGLAIATRGDVFVAFDECLNWDGLPPPCEHPWRLARLAAANGATKWSIQEPERGPIRGVVLDSAQTPVAFGYTGVVKYNGSSGTPVWSRGTLTGAIARIDGNDDVAVLALGLERKVEKLDGATGNPVWSRPVSESGSASRWSNDLRIAPNGDVVGAFDDRLVRWSAATGDALWDREYRAFEDADSGMGISPVDGSVFLAGNSGTIHVHGENGSVLYHNDTFPGVAYVTGIGLAVGPAGEAYVAGSAYDGTFAGLKRLDGGRNVRREAVDLTGDGSDAIMWRHTDGRAAAWLMDGTTMASGAELIGPGTDWQVEKTPDFDGDGRSDVLWRHGDGRLAIYLMNGTSPTSTKEILPAGTGWSVSHIADLDGDGKADILFSHTDGSVAAWLMDGATVKDGATLLGPGTDWRIAAVGDSDFDGRDDLLWRHSDGSLRRWRMEGLTTLSIAAIANTGSLAVTATPDLDGDGRPDLILAPTVVLDPDTTNGPEAWLFDGAQMTQRHALGIGVGVLAFGDFDADSHDELVVRNAAGAIEIWRMNGTSKTSSVQLVPAGTGWTIARLLDMNSDGKADIVWQHADGRVAVWLMDGTTLLDGSEVLAAGSGWAPTPLLP
jgi:outer membrane protein assembly factor BamB